MGAQGRVGVLTCWTSYREFWFESNRAELNYSHSGTVNEIANYMRNNPSLKLGIDASLDPRTSDSRDRDLSNRRINAIHDALVKAGVPADRIEAGAFGDTKLRRDRRVEVLLVTAN
jgi:outer membrane protein OmpA-like peptidoglycan-associated protein